MVCLVQKYSVVCLNSVPSLKRENSPVFHRQQALGPEAPAEAEAPAVAPAVAPGGAVAPVVVAPPYTRWLVVVAPSEQS